MTKRWRLAAAIGIIVSLASCQEGELPEPVNEFEEIDKSMIQTGNGGDERADSQFL